MTQLNDNLLNHYTEAWRQRFAQSNKGWWSSHREQQFELFLSKGFPTQRDEDWKYTSLNSMNSRLFHFAKDQPLTNKEQIKNFSLSGHHYRLVFIDGFFSSELSILSTNDTYVITSLSDGMHSHNAMVQKLFLQQQKKSAFASFNAACAEDGAFIFVPENCKVDRPIHILFLSSTNSSESLQSTRNIIFASPSSNVTILEEHQSLSDKPYLSNVVTQLFVEKGARVEYIKLQNQNRASFHIGNVELIQKQDSRILSHHYNLGGELARDDLHCYLTEKGANFNLQGLYLPFAKQHLDFHTFIYHQADHTSSEELVKGVIASKSKAVFNGKIVVEKNIKQAIANLQNKNLLLARDAEVNTKPELEIYSDDVKCRHGATTGQLDKEMLFYLRSRGIPKEKAYQLLLLAFVREHLNAISVPVLADKILANVTHLCEEVIR